ncbi:MAG TPA: 1-phosphofructokinase family hexose kinase [Sphingomicrobium sp.]|nr:1-phosphofructokinase family hexose kinase [Sphingomicrobium sp.]
MSGRRKIVTLTLNPAIDVSSEADTVRHTHKVRTRDERIEPGGGGINVARVLSRLGADVEAIFLGGGATGQVLEELLQRGSIERRMIAIADDTRLSLTVVEQSTGNEYRFVPEGPEVSPTEAEAALETVSAVDCDYLVASGSLPRGLPASFYVDLCKATKEPGTRFVLDTSGEALREALDFGGIFLVKPSRREFEALVGRSLTADELIAEAQALVAAGKTENIAITLGREGAILVTPDGADIEPALPVEACSAVGAGDSFLAGMVHGFASGLDARGAFRVGLAAGAAAVLSCGSDLAKPEDLKRLVGQALSGE